MWILSVLEFLFNLLGICQHEHYRRERDRRNQWVLVCDNPRCRHTIPMMRSGLRRKVE